MNLNFSMVLISLLIANYSKAQNQNELINIEYRSTAQASINNELHNVLNEVNYANSFLNFSMNYEHSFKDTTLSMIYSLDYNNVSQDLDLSYVTDNTLLDLLPNKYYEYPQFSQLSISTGMNKALKNNWSITGMLITSIVDDFFKPELSTSVNFGGLTYVEKEHNKKLSYGLGLFLGQTENRLVPSFVLSFNYQNKKRGIEILFPSNIRMWQMINKKSYLEMNAYSNFYSLRYNPDNPVRSMDIISTIPEFTYNYIWDDFLRFKIGVDFPLNTVTITAKDEIVEYNQFSLGLKLGLSLVIE
jgi:hypothetical protein